MTAQHATVIVLGLGNRLRGDDAVGPLVVERLAPRLPPRASALTPAGDALSLLAAWERASTVFVVDAGAGGAPAGAVRRLALGAHTRATWPGRASSHGPGLAEALSLGQRLGVLPGELVCYLVEGRDFGHGQAPSPEVGAAIEPLVRRLLAEIAQRLRGAGVRPAG